MCYISNLLPYLCNYYSYFVIIKKKKLVSIKLVKMATNCKINTPKTFKKTIQQFLTLYRPI